MVDPEHRFLADRHVVALHQLAIAPQQPHFIRAFLPAIGRLGRNVDRLDVVALRHVDLGKSVAGSRSMSARKAAGTSPMSASGPSGRVGALRHSATASRRADARRCLIGADLSPSRFSRLASLLAWPNGETANCKQKSRKPLRKT